MSEEKNASVFKEWADVTTAHGFLDFSRARTIIGKFIWFILIFLSFYLMIYQLYRGGRDYASHEWKTSIQQKRPDKGGLAMPSIVICNANRLKYSKAKEYNLTLDMIRFLFLNLMSDVLAFDYSITAEEDFNNWLKEHNFTLKDIFENIGPRKNDYIPREADFTGAEEIFIPEYGNCIRSNFNTTVTAVGSKGSSTFLILNTQSWDYLPIIENNPVYEGLLMQIVYDDKVEFGKWTMLYPGTHNLIGMQAVEETVREDDRLILNPLAWFHSEAPCQHNPSMPLSNTSYSEVNCIIECNMVVLNELCHCVPFFPSEKYRTCDVGEIYKCNLLLKSTSNDTLPNSLSEELNAKGQQCTDTYCVTPCSKRYVELQMSNTKFPSSVQETEFKKMFQLDGITNDDINDFIVLEIYFNSLSIKTIEMYEAVTFDSFISSAGGVIGLWAGMSFLTVFQAISYFLKFFELLIARTKLEQKNSSNNVKEADNIREEIYQFKSESNRSS